MPREKALCGKEDVFRAAIEIVDEKGIAALSVRAIAKTLGVSPMTIYNYVENLQAIKKRVLISGFDKLYDFVYLELGSMTPPVDKFGFCKCLAMAVYKFSVDNREVFSYMFSEGRTIFSADPEIRAFYSFITKITKHSKATRNDYMKNRDGYKLLEIIIFSVTYGIANNSIIMTESDYMGYIDYYLNKCIT